MAMTPEQVAMLRQLGPMLFGAAAAPLHTGLSPMQGMGQAARPGGRVWEPGATRAPDMRTPEQVNLAVAQELAEKMRSEPIDFDAGIVYVPGPAQNNAMFVRTPNNIDAFIRQTPEEHEYALNKYMDDPNIPPQRAAKLGIRNEEQLPKWWNDRDPRLPVTPSSSCVSSARIGDDGDIYIRFAPGGKEYQYEGSADPVKASQILAQLVTSESIGRAVNSWTGDWGTKHTYLPKG